MASDEGLEALASLEQRITRAVDIITTLRTENDELRDRVASMEEERKQVKARIEKLLNQLDLLSAS